MSKNAAHPYPGLGPVAESAHPASMALGLSAAFAADPACIPAENRHLLEGGPVRRYFGASYGLLDRSRPDVASLARFAHCIEVACFYMCVAFERGGVHDFALDLDTSLRRVRGVSWFNWIADTTFCRFHILRRALKHPWTPPEELEQLTYSAFYNLCDLTPASGHHLKQLYISRREDAIDSLVNQLDLTAKLLEEAVALASQSDAALHDRIVEDDSAREASIQVEILGRSGEILGLREAAKRLKMSHQNLHKRIRTGSALGIMRNRELLVPTAQFVAEDNGWKIVPELKRVVALFEESGAGLWSALQFLVDHDPLLGAVPMERLKAADVGAVVHAARGFLGIDEL